MTGLEASPRSGVCGYFDNFIPALADLSTLLYHEGRNVRHLVRAGYASAEQYQILVSLPRNRYEAWAALQPVR